MFMFGSRTGDVNMADHPVSFSSSYCEPAQTLRLRTAALRLVEYHGSALRVPNLHRDH